MDDHSDQGRGWSTRRGFPLAWLLAVAVAVGLLSQVIDPAGALRRARPDQFSRGAKRIATATDSSLAGAVRGGAGVRHQAGARAFRHPNHQAIPCARCHSSAAEHGRVTIQSPQDCLSCHHAAEQRVACAACHERGLERERVYEIAQVFQVGAGPAVERPLPFVHEEHVGIRCVTCHTASMTLSARATRCESCHEQHHAPAAACTRCHLPPPDSVHPRLVHVTCSDAGCHGAEPFMGQRTRNLCLSCHQKLIDHKPGGNCVDCHVLPPLRLGAGPGRGRGIPDGESAARAQGFR